MSAIKSVFSEPVFGSVFESTSAFLVIVMFRNYSVKTFAGYFQTHPGLLPGRQVRLLLELPGSQESVSVSVTGNANDLAGSLKILEGRL